MPPKPLTLLLLTLFWLSSAGASPAAAETNIPQAAINTAVGASGVNSGDGCSLAEAIINANNDAATHAECTAGSGADFIHVPNGTYTYSTPYSADNALPSINTAITIYAHGSTFQYTGGNMRFLWVRNGATLTLHNAQIQDFFGAFLGGAIQVEAGGTATLTNTDLINNRVAPGGSGGGIYNEGQLTLNHSTISGGMATIGGGIRNNGNATLNYSTIHNNFSAFSGGGIRNGGNLAINHSTISNNRSDDPGGGIFGGNTSILFSTITGNEAENGGGIAVLGSVVIRYSIISGNLGGVGREIYRDGGVITTDSFNVFGHSGSDNFWAFFMDYTPGPNDFNATSDGANIPLGNIINPALADNGGGTTTHAVVAGSPAISLVAVGVDCVPGTTSDQRGAARANGPSAGGPACDAGAFEFNSNQTPTAVTLQSYAVAWRFNQWWLGVVWVGLSLASAGVLYNRQRQN